MLEFAQRLLPSTLLSAALEAHVRIAWREKLPQGFSDSPSGAYFHGSYGAPGQTCAKQQVLGRSPQQAAGLAAIEAAGGRTVRIWEAAIAHGTGGYIGRRTPYLHGKLDCTHWCEPSGLLEHLVDVSLAALGRADTM
jgi:hypothetical protein